MDPLVSVIVVTYNQRNYIAQAIESAIAQDYPNVEVIVADDSSDDGTSDIAKEYERRNGALSHLRQATNVGITENCNAGLSRARGRYIAWLGGDDQFLPGKLKKQVALFRSEPSLALVGTDVEVFFEDESPSEVVRCPVMATGQDVHKFVRAKGHIPTSAFMFDREKVPRLTCDTRLKVVSDWLFNVECAMAGGLGYVPEVLTRYRRHSKSVTAASPSNSYLDDRLISGDILIDKYPALHSSVQWMRYWAFVGAAKRRLMYEQRKEARELFLCAVRERPTGVEAYLGLAASCTSVRPTTMRRVYRALFRGW